VVKKRLSPLEITENQTLYVGAAPLKADRFFAKHHNKPVQPAPNNLPKLTRHRLIKAQSASRIERLRTCDQSSNPSPA
jgi:hypothetical protein